MRPVARIAQSVEQGIENPRVLGSIPSPGTTYSENPPKRRVFAFSEPDSSSNSVRLFAASGSPLRGQRDKRCSTPAALVRVRAPLLQKTQLMAGFLLLGLRSISGRCNTLLICWISRHFCRYLLFLKESMLFNWFSLNFHHELSTFSLGSSYF